MIKHIEYLEKELGEINKKQEDKDTRFFGWLKKFIRALKLNREVER